VPLALELEGASGVRVGAELLYDYPTMRALAAYIDAQRNGQWDVLPDEQSGKRSDEQHVIQLDAERAAQREVRAAALRDG